MAQYAIILLSTIYPFNHNTHTTKTYWSKADLSQSYPCQTNQTLLLSQFYSRSSHLAHIHFCRNYQKTYNKNLSRSSPQHHNQTILRVIQTPSNHRYNAHVTRQKQWYANTSRRWTILIPDTKNQTQPINPLKQKTSPLTRHRLISISRHFILSIN